MAATTTPDRELARWTERLQEIDERLAAIAVGRSEASAECDEAMGSRFRRAKAAVATEHPITVRDRKFAAYDAELAELLADCDVVSERIRAVEKDVAEWRREQYIEDGGPLDEAVRDALGELCEKFNEATTVWMEKLIPAAQELAQHRAKAPDAEARAAGRGPLDPWPISFFVALELLHLVATSEARESPSMSDRALLLAQLVPFTPRLLEQVTFTPDLDVIYPSALR